MVTVGAVFWKDAVDIERLRKPALALGDIYSAIDHVPRESIAGHYLQYRRLRANGTPSAQFASQSGFATEEMPTYGRNTVIY